jgi:hypothetical protein
VDATAAGGEVLAPVWLRALAWVEASAPLFAIPEPASGAALLAGLKAAGEAARVGEVVGRVQGLPPAALSLAQRLVERSWRSLREGKVLAELLDERPELAALGALYAPFHKHGLMGEATRARLAELWSAPRSARPPARDRDDPVGASSRTQMGPDAPWVLALWVEAARQALGFPVAEGRVSGLLGFTLLGRCDPGPPVPAFVSSVAHAAFFATDWGARPQAVPAEARSHLEAKAPAWMQECRDRGDLDAWAELALALACVDALEAAGDVEGVLRAAQRTDGSLPGRPQLAYHATLTGALASFAANVGLARD